MVKLQVSACKYLIPYTNCIIALITNIVLLYLIQFHSRKIIGKYAHLMMCFAVYEMIYIISDVLISPISWNFEKSNNFTNFIQILNKQYTLTLIHGGRLTNYPDLTVRELLNLFNIFSNFSLAKSFLLPFAAFIS